MQLTENFNIKEFACKDGSQVPENLIDNVKLLAENLQVLRYELGLPIKITSGYRSPEYNKRVRGAKNSQHLQAKAADIQIAGLVPKQVYKTISKLIEAGYMKQGGLSCYKSFVHYDVRGEKARW